METPLSKLIGMRLNALDSDADSVGFTFESCVLRAFTPVRSEASLNSLVGLTVSDVIATGDYLEVAFGDAGRLNISLKASDYQGPEAFVAHFADGVIVAE
jgi:hypothetical protein